MASCGLRPPRQQVVGATQNKGWVSLGSTQSTGLPDYQRQHLLATLVEVSWPPKPPFFDEPFTLMNEIIQNRI